MTAQTTEKSRLLTTLNAMPELAGLLAERDGNIAFNIHETFKGTYHFEIGNRKGGQFQIAASEATSFVPDGKTLVELAEAELSAMGDKSHVPDVFINGELYRSAYNPKN